MLTVSPTCWPASEIVILWAGVSTLIVCSHFFQLFENFPGDFERLLQVRHFLQLKKKRILIRTRAEQAHGFGPVDGPAYGSQGEEVIVLLSIIVMDVRGTDARPHGAKLLLDAAQEIRMADVEAVVEFQMSLRVEHVEP